MGLSEEGATCLATLRKQYGLYIAVETLALPVVDVGEGNGWAIICPR